MDSRLRFRTDADGQLWVICDHCANEVRKEELALDPVDGKYWDVCAPCKQKEEQP